MIGGITSEGEETMGIPWVLVLVLVHTAGRGEHFHKEDEELGEEDRK